MKAKEKYLEGADIILNIKEIAVTDLDCFSSSSCSGRVIFNINCQTKHGYCEDPRFLGEIKILESSKCNKKDTYLLKVKFKKEKYDY